MNRITLQTRRITQAAAAGALALVGTAHAAVPAEVTTALETMKDDAVAVAGLVLIAIIAVASFKFMRRGI